MFSYVTAVLGCPPYLGQRHAHESDGKSTPSCMSLVELKKKRKRFGLIKEWRRGPFKEPISQIALTSMPLSDRGHNRSHRIMSSLCTHKNHQT